MHICKNLRDRYSSKNICPHSEYHPRPSSHTYRLYRHSRHEQALSDSCSNASLEPVLLYMLLSRKDNMPCWSHGGRARKTSGVPHCGGRWYLYIHVRPCNCVTQCTNSSENQLSETKQKQNRSKQNKTTSVGRLMDSWMDALLMDLWTYIW